jgi:hypothetical protein
MANLNFQQPPRSIGSQNLRGGGFGTGSLSGHVTPTSGMFPGSAGLTSSFTPQQLSPNRNLQMGNRLFGSGQRAFPDRRSIPGLGVRLEIDWEEVMSIIRVHVYKHISTIVSLCNLIFLILINGAR